MYVYVMNKVKEGKKKNCPRPRVYCSQLLRGRINGERVC